MLFLHIKIAYSTKGKTSNKQEKKEWRREAQETCIRWNTRKI